MPVAKPKDTSFFTWVASIVVIFFAIVVVFSLIPGEPHTTPSVVAAASTTKLSPVPSHDEIVGARSMGLSAKFIDGAWPASDYIQELYTQEAFKNTGLDDDSAKRLLLGSRSMVANDRDRRAWAILHSLLWDLHIARTFKGSAKYSRYMNNGEMCFMGARIAFGVDKPEGDFRNAISECMTGQASLKSEIDKVRVVKWDEY